MAVIFRNVEAVWTDPVSTWPYEAVVTTLERGFVSDWQPVFREIGARPWGKISRWVEGYLDGVEATGLNVLFRAVITRARDRAEAAEREVVAARVKDAIVSSGLTAKDFAAEIGTSASRLSTYASAQVVPSAALLVRMESLVSQRTS